MSQERRAGFSFQPFGLDYPHSLTYSLGMSAISLSESRVGVVRGDNVVITQSWLNQLGLVLAAVVFEVAIVVCLILFSETVTTVKSMSVALNVAPCFPLFLLMLAGLRVYNERLVVTPNYLIHVTGRISWREHSLRLEYTHIQEIETVQTILQRALGLGDVIVVPLGGSKKIVMRGLRHPREVKDLIRSFKPTIAPGNDATG